MTFKTTTLACLLAGSAVLGALPALAQETKIATVVKIAGIQWFNRMEEGVKKYAADTGVNAFQVGPAQADPQQQVALLEDMIAPDNPVRFVDAFIDSLDLRRIQLKI